MDIERILKKKFGERFEQDRTFKEMTTFRIGGLIKYFVRILNEKEGVFLINLCKECKIPFLILGGGSNVLAKDEGFSGMVISTLQMKEIHFKNNLVSVQSGARLYSLISENAKRGLSGLEWAVSIPGTVGGAVIMNAGAFGGQIFDWLKSVTYYDGKKIKTVDKKDIKFGYRSSQFKEQKNIIIFSACFQFENKEVHTVNNNIKVFIEKRMSTQRVGYPSAGSVFKRLPHITAAEMIDQAGLKGVKVGGAMVSTIHSGYIVNTGGATCKDVLILVDFISKSVYNRFTERIELEVILVGD